MWPVLAFGILFALLLVLVYLQATVRPPVAFSRQGISYPSETFAGPDEMILWTEVRRVYAGYSTRDYPVRIELTSGEQRTVSRILARRLAVRLAAEVAYYKENPSARDSLPEARFSVAGAPVPASDAELAPYRREVSKGY